MGALSAGLALPFSFLAHAGSADGRLPVAYAASQDALQTASTSVLSRWHDYALASITPQFSWAVLPAAFAPPKVLDNYTGEVARANRFNGGDAGTRPFAVSVATRNVSDTPSVVPDPYAGLVDIPQPGLQRTVVAPSLSHAWGDGGTVRLTGILAYQRFASLDLGLTSTVGWTPTPGWAGSSSYGAGARFDVGKSLGDRWRWDLGFQSRVAMGALANYRGVFADQGNFDIPASANASIGYALTPNFGVDIGVQRVMYSAITPFTSSNLPTRFLALLGDGSSPVFAWRDLDVYSIGWTLRDDTLGNVQLRYTTRQQPEPTSKLLANALSSAVANDMISLGWSRDFGANSSLSLAASYATSPYFLLMPTYLQRASATASQVEFEALWSVHF